MPIRLPTLTGTTIQRRILWILLPVAVVAWSYHLFINEPRARRCIALARTIHLGQPLSEVQATATELERLGTQVSWRRDPATGDSTMHLLADGWVTHFIGDYHLANGVVDRLQDGRQDPAR